MAPPFEMPEFYMPFTARLNPNLDAAREHTKAWATAMGMLGTEQQAWSEEDFESADFALFSAFNYPRAVGPELDLITDWHVWGFFLDDVFIEGYRRDGDLSGAQEFLDRLSGLMPLFPPSAVVPVDPLENALADLWPRTAYIKSVDWRRRFSRHIRKMAESAVHELSNIGRDHIPDPIDYAALRRETGGMDFSACLVEHARGIEIPSALIRTRPIRVLRDTFADSDLWRNDIVSYQKEIEHEGQTNNGVLVVQQLLDCDLQQAVDRVNDVVTSRIRQFEHTSATELLMMFEELHLDPISRINVLTYVEGLQDWMAGDLEWTLTTGRYNDIESRTAAPGSDQENRRSLDGPTGLGTAARIPSLSTTR